MRSFLVVFAMFLLIVLTECSFLLDCPDKPGFDTQGVKLEIKSHSDNIPIILPKDSTQRQVNISGISEKIIYNQNIKGSIYIILHSLTPADDSVWVASQALIHKDGSWKGYCYIDTSITELEIYAVATAEKEKMQILYERQKIHPNDLPANAFKSDVITLPVHEPRFDIDKVTLSITSHKNDDTIMNDLNPIILSGSYENLVKEQSISGDVYILFQSLIPEDEKIWTQCRAEIFANNTWEGYGTIDKEIKRLKILAIATENIAKMTNYVEQTKIGVGVAADTFYNNLNYQKSEPVIVDVIKPRFNAENADVVITSHVDQETIPLGLTNRQITISGNCSNIEDGNQLVSGAIYLVFSPATPDDSVSVQSKAMIFSNDTWKASGFVEPGIQQIDVYALATDEKSKMEKFISEKARVHVDSLPANSFDSKPITLNIVNPSFDVNKVSILIDSPSNNDTLYVESNSSEIPVSGSHANIIDNQTMNGTVYLLFTLIDPAVGIYIQGPANLWPGGSWDAVGYLSDDVKKINIFAAATTATDSMDYYWQSRKPVSLAWLKDNIEYKESNVVEVYITHSE